MLTVATVAISFAPLLGIWHLLIGLLIGLTKAVLVAAFFMHLVYGNRLTWIVVSVTVFWLAILVSLTLTDYFSRGLVPYMPGH